MCKVRETRMTRQAVAATGHAVYKLVLKLVYIELTSQLAYVYPLPILLPVHVSCCVRPACMFILHTTIYVQHCNDEERNKHFMYIVLCIFTDLLKAPVFRCTVLISLLSRVILVTNRFQFLVDSVSLYLSFEILMLHFLNPKKSQGIH